MKKVAYSIGSNQNFIKNAKVYFGQFLKDRGYEEKQVGKDLLLYTTKLRRIEISNRTMPTDYGFSVIIYNLKNEDHLILVHVPWNRQDDSFVFLRESFYEIISNPKVVQTILGTKWFKGLKGYRLNES
ncbi:hypothetical protein EHO59_09575 [Leptospira semungkisensis]|uniref:Uncharacterized protein n=1 Tax=Leptospira semungkisensis TaxID=2484985 RepID=A0A4V3JBW4_9LEPT|nr:hypothetical protein [Leptospira semungkisensis]TGK03779.1 hypothetical protein EHO59_09575 [Leptospira semungkisensis]